MLNDEGQGSHAIPFLGQSCRRHTPGKWQVPITDLPMVFPESDSELQSVEKTAQVIYFRGTT